MRPANARMSGCVMYTTWGSEAALNVRIQKCNMDRNGSPTYVERSATDSLSDTQRLIDHVRSLPNLPTSSALVQPIVTPRFAIACSDGLLRGLGELAAAYPRMAIQTHISENAKEIEFTKKLFPDAKHYADVYDMYGLLRESTVLGHACHLTEDEVSLVKRRNAGIAHCPTSNFNLRSGMANVGRYLDRGIKVSPNPAGSLAMGFKLASPRSDWGRIARGDIARRSCGRSRTPA